MKLVGERRALAAAVLAFWTLLYGFFAFSRIVPELTPALGALAGVYGVAFFSLVAGYFWARWFAVGVALYGVITAAVGIWQVGPEPVVLFIGGTHLAAAAMLWGDAMSVPFDGQTAWRTKFHMDDHAVQRLGKSVIRAGVSLPFVLLYALAPKPDDSMLTTLGAVGVLVLATLGLRGLVQLKTWGVLALGAAGALLVAVAGVHLAKHGIGAAAIKPALAGGLLVAATAPFASSMLRILAPR